MGGYHSFSNSKISLAREALKEEYGSSIFDIIDHYPLLACPQTLLRYSYIHKLIEEVRLIPGHICEFGTWRGATAMYMAKVLEEIEPQSQRKIIVFDNFEGLPEGSEEDGKQSSSFAGQYCGNKAQLSSLINIFGLDHRIELIEGDAEVTLPVYFSQSNPSLVSMAYFDFDLYKPTIAAWNAIRNRLSPGSMLLFDEGLNESEWIGEYRALARIINELKDHKISFTLESNNVSRQPEACIRLTR